MARTHLHIALPLRLKDFYTWPSLRILTYYSSSYQLQGSQEMKLPHTFSDFFHKFTLRQPSAVDDTYITTTSQKAD